MNFPWVMTGFFIAFGTGQAFLSDDKSAYFYLLCGMIWCCTAYICDTIKGKKDDQ